MAQPTALSQYQDYLDQNFENGCERFFAPTGFLKSFQRKVQLETQQRGNVTQVVNLGDAVRVLEPVVAGGEGVFDLAAEPGTGKTSVLPFKFPTKRVVVVEPTQFDAWAAFNVATGPCKLRLKGLDLGPSDKVVFTDSYLAASMVLEGGAAYDVMIVDECDSSRGCTRFLAEVKVPGKVLVRMSATVGDYGAMTSKSFGVTEASGAPDFRQSPSALADFVRSKKHARMAVVLPDADAVDQVGELLPEAVRLSTRSRLEVLADSMVDQLGPALYVTDDVCARGLNLNLDAVYDSQLVGGSGGYAAIDEREAYQRRNRVGRNKPGWYYTPGLEPVKPFDWHRDLVRNNVVRSYAGMGQAGPLAAQVSDKEAVELLLSPVPPHVAVARSRLVSGPPSSSDGSSFLDVAGSSVGVPLCEEPVGLEDVDARRVVRVPAWLQALGGGSLSGPGSGASYVVSSSRGGTRVERRRGSRSSGSRSSTGSSLAFGDVGPSLPLSPRSSLATAVSRPVAEGAPYAVDREVPGVAVVPLEVPVQPPVMRLDQVPYDMDWTALIRDRLAGGRPLPTMVPPKGWRYTAPTGMGSDWYSRLDSLSTSDYKFDDAEFEVVCRAWNRLVSQAWVRSTPGLFGTMDDARVEFCVRYFQAMYQQGSLG